MPILSKFVFFCREGKYIQQHKRQYSYAFQKSGGNARTHEAALSAILFDPAMKPGDSYRVSFKR